MEITRHWRLKAQRYRLEGLACPLCGQFIFPPRPVCTKCHCNVRVTRTAVPDECYYQHRWILPCKTVTFTTFRVDNLPKMQEKTA